MGIMGTLNVVFSSATRKLAFVLRILGPPYVSLMSTRSACTTTKYCISAYTVFATTLKVVVHKARDVPKTARRRAHSHFGRDSSRLVLSITFSCSNRSSIAAVERRLLFASIYERRRFG